MRSYTSSMRLFTVWLSSSPKGKKRESNSNVRATRRGLLLPRRGMKKRTVKFWNYDLRNLFFKIHLPILERTRIMTSFSVSGALDWRTVAEYSTILIISDLLLKLSEEATFSTRSKIALLRVPQVRSSSLWTNSIGSSLKRVSYCCDAWQRGSRRFP